MKNKRLKMKKKIRRTKTVYVLEYYATMLVMKCICLVPRSIGLSIGKIIGIYIYLVDRKHRALVIENLKRVYKDKKKSWYQKMAIEHFRNFGMLIFEFFKISQLNEQEIRDILTIEGEENIREALAKGKGVFLMSAHIGNWELVGAGLSLLKLPINVVVKSIRNPYINNIIIRQRSLAGINVIPARGALKKTLYALKKNEIVCFLMDQATSKKDGINVNFFDIPAWTNIGLIVLSLKTGATIIPTFAVREGKNHKVIFQKPFELIRTGNSKVDIRENTIRMNKIIEKIILDYPAQWFWVHNRWKKR